jgi:hypothetical protein
MMKYSKYNERQVAATNEEIEMDLKNPEDDDYLSNWNEEWDNKGESHDMYDDYDNPDDYSYPHRMIRSFMRGMGIFVTLDIFLYYLDWLTNVAALRVSISFDDITKLMTLYVMFVYYIITLVKGSKSLHAPIDISLFICIAFFIFELISNSIVRTTKVALKITKKPIFFNVIITGYLFSLFWWFDVIFIVALYSDISSVPKSDAFTASVFATSGMVGRGARLYRLIKIIQQYKIDSERRKRRKQELEWIALMEYGDYIYLYIFIYVYIYIYI